MSGCLRGSLKVNSRVCDAVWPLLPALPGPQTPSWAPSSFSIVGGMVAVAAPQPGCSWEFRPRLATT